MRFIAVAASSMTGRSCLPYTVSVTVVVRWPTSRAMFSSGTPFAERDKASEQRQDDISVQRAFLGGREDRLGLIQRERSGSL